MNLVKQNRMFKMKLCEVKQEDVGQKTEDVGQN